MSSFTLIVAATEEYGIGMLSTLPWRIPKDMAFFKHVTTHIPADSLTDPDAKNAVIMGRVTWESIPPKFRLCLTDSTLLYLETLRMTCA